MPTKLYTFKDGSIVQADTPYEASQKHQVLVDLIGRNLKTVADYPEIAKVEDLP